MDLKITAYFYALLLLRLRLYQNAQLTVINELHGGLSGLDGIHRTASQSFSLFKIDVVLHQ